MSEETSFYKQIDNKKYSRRLLDAADKCVEGQGNGRIGIEDAEYLFDVLEKDGKYTDLEKDTLAYIRANYRWTITGDASLRGAIRVWAATRGANK
tara:strand:+ start:371 stop:655 length:285 start_codon:yes stop_codon:yes gene_type:complete